MALPFDYKSLTALERKRVTDNYNGQKSMARKRGIEWQFTFETWLEWWGEDYHRRGQGRGKLCCARKNDSGPYSPDNCIKLTHEENSRQMQINKKRAGYKPTGFSTYIPLKERRYIPRSEYRGVPVHTPYGEFKTIVSACEALNIDYGQFKQLCQVDPEHYYRMK